MLRKNLSWLSSSRKRALDRERKKIAREIHDELSHILNALRFYSYDLKKEVKGRSPAMAELVDTIHNLLDRAHLATSDIAYSLDQARFGLGLVSTLRSYLDEFKKQSNIPYTFVVSDESINFSEDEIIGFARILQESLTNIVRHSHAAQVDVALIKKKNEVVLEVRDDGIGFDLGAVSKRSFGLVGIRERALILGGNASIDSGFKKGTVVRVSMPF